MWDSLYHANIRSAVYKRMDLGRLARLRLASAIFTGWPGRNVRADRPASPVWPVSHVWRPQTVGDVCRPSVNCRPRHPRGRPTGLSDGRQTAGSALAVLVRRAVLTPHGVQAFFGHGGGGQSLPERLSRQAGRSKRLGGGADLARAGLPVEPGQLA